ncbi:MAG TPA: glycosyltransferase [Solirubrobacteraceae bacterium]|nr:glycosyltransferase [Solirubrobacteraceae bacterium]
MRVLALGSVYPPHLLGGYEVIWQGVTRELLGAGHTARVLVSDFRAPGVSPEAPEDPDVHRELRWYWEEHRWPRMSLSRTVALERHNAATLARHLSELRPDVVAFWPMGGMSLSLITAVQRAGLPHIFFVLDPWPVYGPRRDAWLARWRRLPLAPLAPAAARLTGLPARLDLGSGRWIFCSSWMATAAGLDPPPADGAVLSPGVEDRFLGAPAPAQPWRWRLLYIGRVVEQKGVLTAVEALAQLPETATLTIVGNGDLGYRRELEVAAISLGVEGRVEFRPAVGRAEAPDVYAEADVVLFPVRWGEPWGLVPLEAMAVGRPVVGTAQGGAADFLRDGVNALIHTAEDAAGLAAAVRRLGEEPTLRETLVAAGRHTAEAHSAIDFDRAAAAEILALARGSRR